MVRRRSPLILTVAAAFSTCRFAWADTDGQQLAENAGRPLIGRAAPRLVLETIDGTTIDLGRIYGHKAVYLKFWATWCEPCREQMPHFERTYEHAGSDLEVIAVNAGFNDSIADVKAFRAQFGLKMPIVIDDGVLAGAFGLRVTPQHVIIGRDGRVAYVGHAVNQRLEAELKAARERSTRPLDGDEPRSTRAPRDEIGASVKSASITTIDGRELRLSDPSGKRATILMFISPWCESYLKESRPERAAACARAREQSEILRASSRLRWIGIASALWATEEDLRSYRSKNHVKIELSFDAAGSWFRRFGIRDVPTLIVVSPSGRITARIDRIGEHFKEQLAEIAR